MQFKNFKRTKVRAADAFGRSVIFQPGEEREVPAHLEELVLSFGLAPMEDVTDFEQRSEKEKADKESEAAQNAQADIVAEEATAKALEAAAERAEEAAAQKRSEAARKSAFTRKTNKKG